jgi:retron-type reverse transcriptase
MVSLKQENLNKAYLQVYRNKGAAGVDKVQVTELQELLHTHKEQYIEQIENGKYQTSPILGVEIPKSNGKTPSKKLLTISILKIMLN